MRNLALIAVAVMVVGCASSEKVTDLRSGQEGWLSYRSSIENISLSGQLVFPAQSKGRVPAMIVAHGSGGLDARSERWASFLREHGIATFKIDYFGPRGVTVQSSFQPIPVQDANDALRLIATHPRIDPSRIGIIGFSRGATIALAAANATTQEPLRHRFAAHVALYPPCAGSSIRRGGSEAPVLVLVGSRDELAPVSQCEFMVRSGRDEGRDVTLKVYEGAYHAWDGDFSGIFFHRAINRSYPVQMDAKVTAESRVHVLEFLERALKLSSTADLVAQDGGKDASDTTEPYERELNDALEAARR